MTTTIPESLIRPDELADLHPELGRMLRLHDHAISEVFVDLPGGLIRSHYSERPLCYRVRLAGESRLRRVYTTPIGNVSVVYLKSKGHCVYCGTALEIALERMGA